MIFLIGIPIASILVFVSIIFIVYNFAQEQKFWTTVPEGQILAVVRGESLAKFVSSIKGWYIDPVTHEIEEGRSGQGPLARIFGIYWIGVYPFYRIYTYRFKWNKWDKKEKEEGGRKVTSEEYGIVARDEEVDSLYFQFPYAICVPEAETEGKVKVTIILETTTRIRNPEKALFKTKDWLGQLSAYVLAKARDYVGRNSYENLVRVQKEGNDSDFVQYLFDLNERTAGVQNKNNPGLRQLIGVEIIAINFVSLELVESAKVKEATEALYLAQQESQKRRTLADANRYVREQQGKGERSFQEDLMSIAARDRSTVEVYKWEQLGSKDSSLATYVESGAGESKPIIGLNLQPKKPSDKESNDSQSEESSKIEEKSEGQPPRATPTREDAESKKKERKPRQRT